MLRASVTVKVPGIDTMQRVAGFKFRPGSHPAVDQMHRQWGKRYETFARRRFDRLSRGGGEWPPLAASTLARRRTGGDDRKRYGGAKTRGDAVRAIDSRIAKTKAGSPQRKTLLKSRKRLLSGSGTGILRDKGVLYASLVIGSFGNAFGPNAAGTGIRFGFKAVPHGTSGKTINQIAGYHQRGAGHLPVRRIIVPPDSETVKLMAADAGRMMRTILSSKGGR
jgi:hypothetical protein